MSTRLMRRSDSSRYPRSSTRVQPAPRVPVTPTATDAFAERMLGFLNGAGVALMCSLGHRSGLFDTLAALPPSTSEQIASAAKLNARYVREWLGAMVTARVIEYVPETGTYTLPAAHAAVLTRSAVPNNMASAMQWIAVLGGVEDRILECFRNGGGVHYCQYNRFHEVMAEESLQSVVAGMDEHILGLDSTLRERLTAGIDVLDVGCGSGRGLQVLAKMFPRSRFTGYDLCEEAVYAGRAAATEQGLANLHFAQRDVAGLADREAFDLVFAFDAIHDQAQPAAVLRGIVHALRPDGLFLMQDIHASSHLEKNLANPLGPFLYSISTMHCMSVSLAQGGDGLGTCWGEELAEKMLREAGFTQVQIHRLPHDMLNSYYLARRASADAA